MADTPDPEDTGGEPDGRPEYPCGALGWWPEVTMVPAGVAWGYTVTSARCAPTRPRLS